MKRRGDSFYHSEFVRLSDKGDLPLHVRHIAPGCHPARRFHDHGYSEIAVVMGGGARHLVDDDEVRLVPGDVLVLHPPTVHAYDDTGDFELINLVYTRKSLSLPLLDGYALPLFRILFPEKRETRQPIEPVLRLPPEALKDMVARILALREELTNFFPGNLFASLACFMDIALRLARLGSDDSSEQRIRFSLGEAIRHIQTHFNRPVPVDEIASIAHMSRRNLFRRFQQAVGCSPIEYQMKIRLQHAMELLRHSDLSIAVIALDCGFYDSNFFCRKFREHTGRTPRTFRLHGRGDGANL